jgi:hypothetical protein
MMYSPPNGYGYPMDTPPARAPSTTSVFSDCSYDDSPFYYKDKPTRNHGYVQHPLQVIWSQLRSQNMGMVIVLVLTLVWSLHARSQRAWLLRELQVQSLQEAVSLWHHLSDAHTSVASELDHNYKMSEHMEERDAAWAHQVEILQNATQKESRRAVVDK